MMTEQKRSLPSGDHREGFSSLSLKRHKMDLSISTKEKKEKFGERIATLQQLVSPYGKTDTASVLLEAMDYIRFLHDQVKLLSAPYLEGAPAIEAQQDFAGYSLGRRGLCLVPISSTKTVARTNGADIWAPIKAASPTS